MGTDDVEKRKEGKRALHSQLEGEILDDRSEVYDEDAVPIQTPRGTWPRQEGSIQISPAQLKRVMARSSSPSASREMNPRNLTRAKSAEAAARALSRMLTDRGSRLTDSSTQEDPDENVALEDVPELNKKRSTKKYVFSDDASSPSKTRPPSPLGRSDTVIRTAANATPVEIDASKFLDTPGTPPAPGLNPLRLASISDSIAGKDWRLSFSDSRNVSLHPKLDLAEKPNWHPGPGSQTNNMKWSKAPWLQGASANLASPPLSMPGSWIHADCDPATEEHAFGGVDGKYSSPHSRTHSEGSNPSSVHLFNMGISQRLGSHGIVPAHSSTHLKGESSSEKSWAIGPDVLSIGPRRHASSSGFDSLKVPVSWGVPRKYAASSIYTTNSHHRYSPTSSHSYLVGVSRSESLKDRHFESGPGDQEAGAISTIALPSPSLDLRESELLSTSASPDMRSKSLSIREIEAAEGDRFLQRAGTVAQSRYFSQADLDELTREIAIRSPPRGRSVSRFDGSSEGSSARRSTHGRLSPPRKPSVVVGDEPKGTSVWEKALREHAEEDARLSELRPGSVSTYAGKPHRGRKGKNRMQNSTLRHVHSSSEGADEDVRAHLGGYKLPPREGTRASHPTVADGQRSPSSEHASAWSRFPSHSRQERSNSPADEKDHVFAHDFAPAAATGSDKPHKRHRKRSIRKYQSAHFERLRHSLRDMYRAKSMEFSARYGTGSHGHRSSISEGGLEEYPELEMLPPLSAMSGDGAGSPPLDVSYGGEMSSQATAEPEEKHDHIQCSIVSPAGSARKWSRLYEDCVVRRDLSGGSQGSGIMRHPYTHAVSEHFSPMDLDLVGSFRAGEGEGEDDIRSSTMDFKRGLEESERREREKVLGFGIRGSGLV